MTIIEAVGVLRSGQVGVVGEVDVPVVSTIDIKLGRTNGGDTDGGGINVGFPVLLFVEINVRVVYPLLFAITEVVGTGYDVFQ
jgi:hypothetical protein